MLDNPKHEAFAQAFVKMQANGAAAYKSVYNPEMETETASAAASRLLTNVKVRQRVVELSGKAANKTVLTVEKVLQGIQLGLDLALEQKPKPDLRAYSKFLEMQGKYLKMFTDRMEIDLSTKSDIELLKEFKDLSEQIDDID
jgi:hypothetical protein